MPEKASDAYVQQTFDRFAATFDAVLDKLEYRAPTLVGQAVAALYAEDMEKQVILDAGCGTGLCGDWLKPYAQRLLGVDLSAQMLNKARGRELYDELIEAELVEYLSRQSAVFDLIVSADTLVYFGKLDALFAAAKQALKSDGVLIFTVEKQSGEQVFVLNYHGRYSHSEGYVVSHLQAAGFEVRGLETVTLRKEAGEPVIGMLVTAVVAGDFGG
jgi:predicted TPR repeat methyltransferase